MDESNTVVPVCRLHGKPTKRGTCRTCNAAYMRAYLRHRRRSDPGDAMWERARKRAHDRRVPFALPRGSIFIPRWCPALGIEITAGCSRSEHSPSLDRIQPELGYIPGNVRVICDRANRLKGDRSIDELRIRAEIGTLEHRNDYQRIVCYLEREQLLREVREKAKQDGRAGVEWAKIAQFLDRIFRKSLITN